MGPLAVSTPPTPLSGSGRMTSTFNPNEYVGSRLLVTILEPYELEQSSSWNVCLLSRIGGSDARR